VIIHSLVIHLLIQFAHKRFLSLEKYVVRLLQWNLIITLSEGFVSKVILQSKHYLLVQELNGCTAEQFHLQATANTLSRRNVIS